MSISSITQKNAIANALKEMQSSLAISCNKEDARKDIKNAMYAFEMLGYTANVVTHVIYTSNYPEEVSANVLGFDLKTVSDAYSLRYSEGENPIQDFIKAKHIDRIEFLEYGEIMSVLMFNYKVEQDYKSGDIFLYFDLHGEKLRKVYNRGEECSLEIYDESSQDKPETKYENLLKANGFQVERSEWRSVDKYDFDFEIELYNDEICVELYLMFLTEKELNERMRDC